MKRRHFLGFSGAIATLPRLAGASLHEDRSNAGLTGSWDGYEEAVVIDALAAPIQFNIPQERLPLRAEVLESIGSSGITAVNITVNARGDEDTPAYEATVEKMSAWARQIEESSDVLSMVRSVSDISRVRSDGRLGLIFGFQDGTPFEDDLDRLADFHERGLRVVQPTYNVQNRIGTGCLVREDAGLTALGRDAVARMDELGILLDLSHCGVQTTRDGMRAARGPVAITHSGCKAVFDHPRSKDDATLRDLADRGGVVGIYLMPFLNASGPPTLAHVLAHIEHALNLCGEDHVGIGSDQGIFPLDVSGPFRSAFDRVSAERAAAGIAAPREDTIPYVPDLNHPRRMETIAHSLAVRGHPGRVIEKVMGANFVRLFAEVWG